MSDREDVDLFFGHPGFASQADEEQAARDRIRNETPERELYDWMKWGTPSLADFAACDVRCPDCGGQWRETMFQCPCGTTVEDIAERVAAAARVQV